MMKTNLPQRKCIGCQKSFDQSSLLRISYFNGELNLDKGSKSNGRGVYLCKDINCIKTAFKKRAFNRSFKTALDQEMLDKLEKNIMNAIEK